MKRTLGILLIAVVIVLLATGSYTKHEDPQPSDDSVAQTSTAIPAPSNAEPAPEESTSQFVIDGQTVQLETVSELSDKVSLLIPKTFGIMSEEVAKIKYPSGNRPSVIYTDDSGSVNIALNYTQTQVSSTELEAVLDSMKESLESFYPTAQWLRSEVRTINDKDVGVLELITPVAETDIYNLMWFTDVDGQLLIATFNCTKEQIDDWKPVGETILNSFKLQ